MKKKTYTTGEWALMVAAAFLIVAGAFSIIWMIVYLGVKYGTDIHGEEVKKMAAAAFLCVAGACSVLCVISAVTVKRSRVLLKIWDGEESIRMDRMGSFLDVLSYLFELFFVLLFLASGFRIFVESPGLEAGGEEWVANGAYLVGFLVLTIMLYSFQKILKDAQNEMAESEGSHVYSNDLFTKSALNEWVNHSDEGERQVVYKAAFHTYRVTARILFFAMAFTSFTRLGSTVAITVFTVTGIIWILMSGCFCIERNRLRRKKLR